MGKFAKFFRYPGLYWCDYLIKRYPLQKNNVEIESTINIRKKIKGNKLEDVKFIALNKNHIKDNTNNIDFYFICSHRVGKTSLQRYLGKIRTIIIDTANNSENFIEIIDKYKNSNAETKIGLRLDSPLQYIKGWEHLNPSLFNKNIPIIWAIGNPLQIIASCINKKIRHATARQILSNTHFSYNSKNIEYINELLDEKNILHFSSSIKSVQSSAEIFVVDLQDISCDKVHDTMKEISRILNTEINTDSTDFFTKSFSSDYRFFIWMMPLNLNIDGAIIYVSLNPLKSLFPPFKDRHTKIYRKDIEIPDRVLTLKHFDRCNEIYSAVCAIGTEFDQFSNEQISEILLTRYSSEIDSYARFVLDMYEIYKNKILERKIGPDSVADLIKSDPILHEKFKKLMDRELEMVEKVKPGHTKTWDYLEKVWP